MNTKADPISLIYQATLEPQLWLELLEQMEHLFNEAVHPEQEFNLLAEHCQRDRKITQELHGLQEQSGTWKHLIDHLPMSVFLLILSCKWWLKIKERQLCYKMNNVYILIKSNN
ncbi:hypothetical protein [Paraglaciecola psychrophila]|uniref:Uncharacterized protein n=1 Tax=Paraglaciecola psychrophila 170 TaxID=1129794 RepID=K6ZVN9_9ALTE|nr:hypothetical protein [Paraglaciecola psychrophila]AGH46918.1 hypothetical protein C427_4819 [Paraglaciecola psychrophila 170]GAC39951.1 hypothetical protein GPSY_4348 [Paraglaciecola psychrophila 170]